MKEEAREKADLKMKMEIFSRWLDSTLPFPWRHNPFYISYLSISLTLFFAMKPHTQRSEIGKSWEKKNDVFDILIVVAADVASGAGGCGDKR